MKKINLLYSAIIATITILRAIHRQWQNTAVFLTGFLILLLLMALDSRSLSYIHFNKNQHARQALLVIDFFCKIALFGLYILSFFKPSWTIIIVCLVLCVLEIAMYFITSKYVGDGGVYDNMPPTEQNVRFSVQAIMSYVAYLISVALVHFPNYSIISWELVCLIPLGVAICLFVVFLHKVTKVSLNQNIKWVFLLTYFCSLMWFVIAKYVFEVRATISLFTLIGLAIMLPYFNYIAKEIRILAKSNQDKKE